ncbi:uncharacterized protein CTHT_0018860 [Thermochaetoides thermophila DSM 1495]|uniref:Uncharacterized protein n=1 Tax=Chaetomium thermophilum (strain DSM 1495 / CBS 144.50 / IMI 039719) TaxID=759272 RepID=G0S2X7_CHATD|nr:hypothetical protein CTHT_0018860 [Thermochaetoides thermophila DSM 1495]EGS22360.1 hypothetical protein CTHT_0018860 [Thermochaetoides thermophila DSM 1495]
MHCVKCVGTVVPTALTVSTLATKPEIDTIPESILDTTALGVDVNGPIPSDAVWVELGDGIGYWSARPESFEKWEYANIRIDMWAQDNSHITRASMFSARISCRCLRKGERLEFKRLKGNDWCGTYASKMKVTANRKQHPTFPPSS